MKRTVLIVFALLSLGAVVFAQSDRDERDLSMGEVLGSFPFIRTALFLRGN